MELGGEQIIGASRQEVWQALNDPAVLQRCITGCEEVTRVSDTELNARMMLKIGPVRSRFTGKVRMEDVNAPASCTLIFEGSGGAAGFAKGRSGITLSEVEGGTCLAYTAEAAIGGKLGQIGGRLIDSTAKKLANEFFTALEKEFAPPEPEAAPEPASVEAVTAADTGQSEVDARSGQPAAVAAAMPAAAPGALASFVPELHRAFWFVLGAASALILTNWFS